MKRVALLASTAIVLSLVSACGGQIAGDGGEGTSYGLDPSGSGRGRSDDDDDDDDDGDDDDFDVPGGRSGGGRGDTGSTDPSGGPGAPVGPTPSACFAVRDDSVCADLGTAKAAATKLCASQGYEFASLSIDGSGGCAVTCCDGTTSTPKPPPPPQQCTWTSVGNGSTCMSWSTLKARAMKECASMDLVPRSIHPANDCKNGTRIAKLECCSN